MDFIQIIKWVAVALTLCFGLYAMIKPNALKRAAGLEATGPGGITEIRSLIGGTFVGLAVAAVILNSNTAFTMLGICYAAIAAIRIISMVLDKSVSRIGTLNLAIETILAILLVI